MPAEADRVAPHAAVDTAKQFLSTFKITGRLLVAISGGSDSKGLMLAFNDAMTKGGFSGFSLAACTVDHGLRAQAADEARSVAALCAERGIPHVTCAWRGEKPKTGIQAAARVARYRLLADAAQEMGATCILAGHTADDQAETIAMRQSRSLPDAPGLAGMAAGVLVDRRVWVLRPFLGLQRSTIRDYLASIGEGWIDDPSNTDSGFERVRIRQSLGGDAGLTLSQQAAAKARRHSSERMAALLAENAALFSGLAARVTPELAAQTADPDTRRALLCLAAVIGGRENLPGRETASRLATFLASGACDRMTAARVVFDHRRNGLYLYREARGLPEIAVEPGQRAIWDGRFNLVNSGPEPVIVRPAGEARNMDAGLIAAGLPEAVAKRALKSAPGIFPASSGPVPPDVRLEPHIGLYDTFLPCFDRMIADRIAALFGRDRYLAPPVHDV
ncbi:tRNA lysidine(34) synthetase TilS [Rhizobium sp. Root482]|uniref:tRNA lysidine(34) synthetase TilS n=1 Tax=Rhizobium sp. Root482 TaxID=1736543 RepID=UPI0006F42B30|nr:tRNA lysidine(34) synthetase TilS [Rhizobium sp. Root482]KQY11224.1 tRNA(Ile)-lysidine synthetase [Rhizobium sp. Root482]